uniref:Uncharacterized protein n=1 Tax=Anguilla anguilla TaxID=7936 RepID=A0A0E9WIE3_ANGAN
MKSSVHKKNVDHLGLCPHHSVKFPNIMVVVFMFLHLKSEVSVSVMDLNCIVISAFSYILCSGLELKTIAILLTLFFLYVQDDLGHRLG